jgi:hypothetical protein
MLFVMNNIIWHFKKKSCKSIFFKIEGGCCTQIELMEAAGALNLLSHVIG